jgi:stress response protein YsnF
VVKVLPKVKTTLAEKMSNATSLVQKSEVTSTTNVKNVTASSAVPIKSNDTIKAVVAPVTNNKTDSMKIDVATKAQKSEVVTVA